MISMGRLIGIGLVLTCIGAASCHKAPDPLPIKFFDSNFEAGADEWSGGVAYYKEGTENVVKFSVQETALSEVLKSTLHGMKLQGVNAGDRIFLFLKRKISNLDTMKIYKVAYNIDLVSNLPDTAGGAGRITYLKAGASSNEPLTTLSDGVYLPTIKSGAIAESGAEMLLLGNVANGLDSTSYRAISRDNKNKAVVVKPNIKGEIWLCVGVNTIFKGNISLYFDRIYAAVGEKKDI